jgi:hypothetical protein
MKRLLSRALGSLAVGAALVTSALAAQAGYNPAIVAADARWVVHADFDALRASTLGKELIDALQKAQGSANGGIIGVNIPKLLATVGSVTAYGTNFTSDPAALDGTLIAQGTPDLRKIAESALLQGTLAEPKVFSEVTDLPFPAYAIADPKAPEGKQTQLVIAFPPEPIVLISKSKAQLTKARDVFRGSGPSLAKNNASPLRQLGANVDRAYLHAVSTVPPEMLTTEKGPQARILQLANSASLVIGERGPDAFAQAELIASSDRNAEKLMKILEGMTSMLSLAESNDKQLADFLTSTSVSREKDTVTLKLAYPAERLVAMTQTLRAQAEPRANQRREAPVTIGKTVAEWSANDVESERDGLTWRTIENVTLGNGHLITLGRALQGGRDARFERLEIVPTNGGAPLTFRREFMRTVRNNMQQIAFPGSDGSYTLRVGYINDPEKKAKFGVSIQTATAAAPAAPAPATKTK